MDFLTAEDFQKESDLASAVPLSPEDALLNPFNPPDLSFAQYRRLKAIDFADRAQFNAKRQDQMHDEWQTELDAMRKATEGNYTTSTEDLRKIESHTLQETSRTADVLLENMPASKEEIAAGMSGEILADPMDVPAQDYFNPTLFPEALDAGQWLPKRVKGKCIFCLPDPTPSHVKDIQFTNVQLLHAFINERGMITSRRWNYNCKKHQKKIAKAIRRARVLGFLNPVDNFFAPETFANTDLGDLAKIGNSADLGLYGIGMNQTAYRRRSNLVDKSIAIASEHLASEMTPATDGAEMLRQKRDKQSLADVVK